MTEQFTHDQFMALALKQASYGQLIARPNPAVGCVLVKDNKVVGAGFTQEAGGHHAEVMAMRAAGDLAVGSTAYVTLEPCSHYGRTPPCSLSLIEAGVSCLVYGCQDPNPQVSGQGLAQLRAANVEVVVLRDDPSMNVRADELALAGVPQATIDRIQQPLRVVLDSQLRLPVSARLVQQNGPVLVVTCVVDPKQHQSLVSAGAEVVVCAADDNGKVDLAAVLALLGQRDCNQVLVEAGAGLSGAFLQAGLTDHLVVFMAPKLLGNKAKGLFNLPLEKMAQAHDLDIKQISQVGCDWRIDAAPKRPDN